MEIRKATLYSRRPNKPIDSIKGFENQFDTIIAFEEESEFMEMDLDELELRHPKSKKYFRDIRINLNTLRNMLGSVLQWIDWEHLRPRTIEPLLTHLHDFVAEKKYSQIPTLILNKQLVSTYQTWSEMQIQKFKTISNPIPGVENYFDYPNDSADYSLLRTYMHYRTKEMYIETVRFISEFFGQKVETWIVQNHIEWAAMTQLTKCLEHMILC
jgi:hypothetical protein